MAVKRTKIVRNREDYLESPSSKFTQDEEAQLFKTILSKIKRKYHVSPSEILDLTKEEVMIPCTAFNKKLSPLETGVKYLKENINLDYQKIADLLGRDKKTIWQAYKNSTKKSSKVIEPKETNYKIPVSALCSPLSILEATVTYMKDQYHMSYHQIGEILQRNERTVWTVYSRAQKKKNE